jgi:hypothetical protein
MESNKIRIVTDYWRIVDSEIFLFIEMRNGVNEETGEEIYSVIGVLDTDDEDDESPRYMPLCSGPNPDEIIQNFHKLLHAMQFGMPKVVDFRKVEIPTGIQLLKFANNKPGSELN